MVVQLLDIPLTLTPVPQWKALAAMERKNYGLVGNALKVSSITHP